MMACTYHAGSLEGRVFLGGGEHVGVELGALVEDRVLTVLLNCVHVLLNSMEGQASNVVSMERSAKVAIGVQNP